MTGHARGRGIRFCSAILLTMAMGGAGPRAAFGAEPAVSTPVEAGTAVVPASGAQVISSGGATVVATGGTTILTPQSVSSAVVHPAAGPPVAPPPPPPPPPPPSNPPKPVNPPPTAPPPPPPPPPPGTPTLFGAARVGRALFFDTTLSNPAGMACATCHSPQSGWEYPNSTVNQATGTVPGVIPTRYGNRRPPTVSYTAFLPPGPPVFNPAIFTYQGGLFYDGRAANLAAQVPFPLENPNEMNNVVHNVASPALVVQSLESGPNAALFKQTFGSTIFSESTTQVFQDLATAIAAFEQSVELSPFSSQYDAYLGGKAALSPQAMHGLQLFTGSMTGRPGGAAAPKNAQCVVCHTIPDKNIGTDIFTEGAYANTGTPKNPANPYYQQTSATADPLGYNPLGAAYIDYGLGDFLYPKQGLPSGNVGKGSSGKGDFLNINGIFKIPTVRNVNSRPKPQFVKAYSHNGFFKSLQQVVHFYNTRNLTTVPGEVIDFSLANPYAKLKGKPLWPAPENPWPNTIVNPTGATGASGGLVGNLGLTPQDEADIVSFLQTLTDAPPPPPQ